MTMKHLHIVVNNDGTILALLPLRALRALLALLTLLALLALLSLLALLTLLTLVTLLALLALLTLRALLTYHITLNACTTRITRALTSDARPLHEAAGEAAREAAREPRTGARSSRLRRIRSPRWQRSPPRGRARAPRASQHDVDAACALLSYLSRASSTMVMRVCPRLMRLA